MNGLLDRFRDTDADAAQTEDGRGELIKTPEYTKTIVKPHVRRTERFHFVRGDPVDVTYDKTITRKVKGIVKTEYHKGVETISYRARNKVDKVWPEIRHIRIADAAEHQETIIEGNVTHVTPISEEQMRLEQDVKCATVYYKNELDDARAYINERVGAPRLVPVEE